MPSYLYCDERSAARCVPFSHAVDLGAGRPDVAEELTLEGLLKAIAESREADERRARELREEDERHARELREADERYAREAREADERLSRKIEALTGTVGNYVGETLEAVAATYVMRWLEIHEGLEFLEVLHSRYVPIDGIECEFDLYGRARRDRQEVLVVGETKRTITLGDVVGFHTDSRRLAEMRTRRLVRVIFCVVIEKAALREAKRRDIRVITHRRRPSRKAGRS